MIFSFTSKYLVSLYELLTARINMEYVWEEEFSLQDIWALGVPEDKLRRMSDLLHNCINIAVAEIKRYGGFRGKDRANPQRTAR